MVGSASILLPLVRQIMLVDKLQLIVPGIVTDKASLFDYLLPHRDLEQALLPELRMRRVNKRLKKTPSQSVYSTSTGSFDPGAALDWNRIPYRVYHCDLRPMMLQHFQELLSDNPAAKLPVSEKTKAAYLTMKSVFDQHEISDEPSVSVATSHLHPIVQLAYEDLTGSKIKSRAKVSSELRAVITDYVLHDDSDAEEVVLLWENKSPTVFDIKTENLQEALKRGPVTYNLNQTTWEGWQAILAKVVFRVRYDLAGH